ncbi:threonine-phosphate decarboxylase CobD [Allorhizobium undicola]|uniref:threonine-phosphate decarboxylase CobD n=1 Tax=Allorhizobium undicola TaxID=78527 RepID=UPI003D32AE9A
MSGSGIAHGGGLAAAALLHGGRVEDWLDLSTGINPCPPALGAIDPRAWHRLPDREREDAARHAARSFYGCGANIPLPVPGTQAAIQLLPQLLEKGARAAILSPTYGEYARCLARAGHDVDAVAGLDEIGPKHGLAVIVNPNNPTGRKIPATSLLALAERMAATGGLLVVDEAFADAEPEFSLASHAATQPNLLIFRSFGKFFGLAGLRLGFVIAGPAIVQAMSEALGPWPVSGPALSVAIDLFARGGSLVAARIAERRKALQAVLDRHGMTVIGGTALFALVEDERAQALHEHLCRAHILTRAFDYAPHWLRIGLAPDEAGDDRFDAALAAWKALA